MDAKIDKSITLLKALKDELAKNVNGSYTPPGNGGAMAMSESKFKEVQHKIEGEGHSADSAARITAAIGRKEIGQKEMTRRSVAARKSDDKEDVKLAEEIEDKVLAHVKRNKKDEKAEGHDLKIDKAEKHQEGVTQKKATTWMPKQHQENLRCSEGGQWKLDNTKKAENPCQCHDCVQFGLSKHPEPKPAPATKSEIFKKPGDGKVEAARKAFNAKQVLPKPAPPAKPKLV